MTQEKFRMVCVTCERIRSDTADGTLDSHGYCPQCYYCMYEGELSKKEREMLRKDMLECEQWDGEDKSQYSDEQKAAFTRFRDEILGGEREIGMRK